MRAIYNPQNISTEHYQKHLNVYINIEIGFMFSKGHSSMHAWVKFKQNIDVEDTKCNPHHVISTNYQKCFSEMFYLLHSPLSYSRNLFFLLNLYKLHCFQQNNWQGHRTISRNSQKKMLLMVVQRLCTRSYRMYNINQKKPTVNKTSTAKTLKARV